jgi:hypothetical protein
MRFLTTCVCSLTLAAAAAAERPLIDVQLASGAALADGWAMTPLGRTLASPDAAPLLAPIMAELQQSGATDPAAAFRAMQPALARIDQVTVENGAIRILGSAQIDLGPLTNSLWEQFSANRAPAPVAVAGADAVLALENHPAFAAPMIVARFGTTLVFAQDPASCVLRTPATASHAASVAVDLDRIREVLAAMAPIVSQHIEDFTEVVTASSSLRGSMTWTASWVPEGILEHLQWSSPEAYNQPVDKALISRLPATTLLSLAWGLDGAALWTSMRPQWLRQYAQSEHLPADMSLDEIESSLNADLAKNGLTITLAEIITGLSGTSVFALTPGAMFPSGTVVVPRSAATDAVVAHLVELFNAFAGGASGPVAVPAVGQSVVLPIQGAPVMLTLLRDETSWVLTSDMGLPRTWLAGTPGGYLDAPATVLAYQRAKALGGRGPVILGTSDTPALFRLINGYAGLLTAQLPPEQQGPITAALQSLAANVGTGYVVGCQGTTGGDIEIRGVLGSFIGPALIGGTAISRMMFSLPEDDAADVEIEPMPAPEPAP